MKKKLLCLLLFSFLMGPVWAKDLLIATIAHAAPFEFQDEVKGLSGFDIDIMNALCKKMKVHCQFKIYEFSQIFPALQKGEVDLAIASIEISPKRREQFLFSLPYKQSKLQFITLASNPLTRPKQLINKRIGLYKNAPDNYFVAKKIKGPMHIHYYEHVDDLFDALKKNDVDAIAVEASRAKYWLANLPGFKQLGKPFGVGEGYGIAANLGRDKLIKDINRHLEQMENDGTYLQIYNLYF